MLEYGADINQKTVYGKSVAYFVLTHGTVESAHYIIIEKKANFTEPYYANTPYEEERKRPRYAVNLLRTPSWIFPVDSKEYKLKMEIVEEFVRQGIDYWSTPLYDNALRRLKRIYPDTWQDYVDKI